jgi:hypothetical protein
MFGPWLVMFSWLKKHTPSSLSAFKPHPNFITIHCVYTNAKTVYNLG